VRGILAAPPCTDFSVSGAQYWDGKDKSGKTEESIVLVELVLIFIDWFKVDFWALENPIGRISALVPQIGKPWYYDPFEYAGYLNLSADTLRSLDRIRKKQGHGLTPQERSLILSTNTYTKKTAIYGTSHRPDPKPIEPVKGSPQGSILQSLGGKSKRTKWIRSITPKGFAKAFYLFNH
jgi:hypothetical protein